MMGEWERGKIKAKDREGQRKTSETYASFFPEKNTAPDIIWLNFNYAAKV